MLTPNNTMPLTITDDQGVEHRLHAIDFGPVSRDHQPVNKYTAYLYATDIKDAKKKMGAFWSEPNPTVTALG